MGHYDECRCEYCGGSHNTNDGCMWSRLELEFDIARKAMDEQTRTQILEKVEPLIKESQERGRRFITVFNLYKCVLKNGLKLDYEQTSAGGLRIYGVIRGQKVMLDYMKDNAHAA